MSNGINRQTGKPLSGWDHVYQSLVVILTTRLGERVMRRTFGSSVPSLLGRNLVPATMLKFYMAIALAVELWEPRFRIRKFELPPTKNSSDELGQGHIGIRMVGDYRPRALEGDFTVEAVKSMVL